MSPPAETPPDLADIIALDDLGEDRFRGVRHQKNHVGGVFGGSMLAQALRAAELSAPGRAPNSLHGRFHRGGAADAPIDYEVVRTREGGSFSTRRVSARQHDRLLFEALVSLQAPEDGFVRQQAWREAPPPPLSVPTLQEMAAAWGDQLPAAERAIILRFGDGLETRVIDAEDWALRKGPPRARFWIRPSLRSDRRLRSGYAALAFVSDYLMPATCILTHVRSVFDPALIALSLDHSIWFHGPAPAGGWLLYEADGPWTGGGRGLSFGRLYTEDGRLVASSAQEQLVRMRA
jgi:acyl-CoA thioesterase-2